MNIFQSIVSYTWADWIILICLPLIIMGVINFFRAILLASHPIIKDYVKRIDPMKLSGYNESKEDILSIQKEFKLQGKDYGYLLIEKALSMAIDERKKSKKYAIDIRHVDQMTGIEFEQFLRDFFQRNGYQVKLTKASGDQGVDLLLYKDSQKIAVQCKRYRPSSKVGNSAVQEVLTGKIFYDCTEAWVITTSSYTPHAIQLANKVGVRLIDRNGLMKMFRE